MTIIAMVPELKDISFRLGYIAGVTNPIFEAAGQWDLLCDVGTGRMVVNKDIQTQWPSVSSPSPPGVSLFRTGTLKPEGSMGSEEEMTRGAGQTRGDVPGKADVADNIFMEDVSK